MTPTLGLKRQCPKCATRYYDLGKETPVCPHCGHEMKLNKPVRVKALKAVKAELPKAKKPSSQVEEVEVMTGMGGVAELEEIDEFDEDIEHLQEVEEHQEPPARDINSDDADDDMFIDELSAATVPLVDSLDDIGEDAEPR